MAHSPQVYAHALHRALKDEADESKRSRIWERFRDVLNRKKAVHLLPAIVSSLGKIALREQGGEPVRVKTAYDTPELIAGVEVYKGDTLVDNTLKSRFARLTKALNERS